MPVILKENRIQNFGPNCVLAASLQDLAGITEEGWTIAGAPTIIESPFGKAIRLDGTSDWIIIDDENLLRFDSGTQDFSIVTMVMTTLLADQEIVDKRDANDDGYRLLIIDDGRVFGSVNGIDVVSANGAITPNLWYLIGLSVNRTGNGQIYINGLPSGAAVAIGGAVMATTSDLYIGRRSYADAERFNGDIKSVDIYKSNLLASDQLSLYENYAGLGTNP